MSINTIDNDVIKARIETNISLCDGRTCEIIRIIDRRLAVIRVVAATTGDGMVESLIRQSAGAQVSELEGLREELMSKYGLSEMDVEL